jgi:predicted amidohydrolase YtcJ
MRPRSSLSRRELLAGAGATVAAALTGGHAGDLRAAQARGAGAASTPAAGAVARIDGDVVLVNGKFVDHRGMVGSTLTIHNGRIAGLGPAPPRRPDLPVIDLGGRTAVPGFVDAHVHYTRAGVNPGYEARGIERAFSIAELQQAIASRAKSAPPGAFITCIGGWNHTQLAENRRPTKRELDDAAPAHAVYVSGTGGGTGALTNSRGQTFFAAKGVMVDEAGVVMSAQAAVAALQAAQTAEDRLRGTADLIAFAASRALTTVVNSGNFGDQELPLRLWRENRLRIRMRPTFPAESPAEVETRALNNFSQGGRAVGDDLFRVAGFGERIGGTDPMGPQFEATARMIAKHRWLLQQHSITLEENDFHLAAFRSIAKEHPIGDLRWALLHLQRIDAPRLQALKDLGAGASAQTWTYMGNAGGPPFKRILESGIQAGVGTDSTNVAALDPWLSIYYMTTGRNVAGMLTNDGQQVSRLEALRLYTVGAAWFAFDDHQVGSFELGKLADLAVLSHDYLTVPDAMLRKIESVLTLVGGRVAHAAVPFA